MRTSQGEVAGLLGSDWEQGRSLSVFLRSATKVVDRVIECLARKGLSLDSDEAQLMEAWVTAWLYTKSDPTYSSRSTLSASGSFLRTPESYLEGAKALDPGGCLAAIIAGARASAAWLGRPPSEQTDYVMRD